MGAKKPNSDVADYSYQHGPANKAIPESPRQARSKAGYDKMMTTAEYLNKVPRNASKSDWKKYEANKADQMRWVNRGVAASNQARAAALAKVKNDKKDVFNYNRAGKFIENGKTITVGKNGLSKYQQDVAATEKQFPSRNSSQYKSGKYSPNLTTGKAGTMLNPEKNADQMRWINRGFYASNKAQSDEFKKALDALKNIKK